jgi:hypothetical protein
MSSRAEEKERRRQERLAAEQAAQAGADRRKRMGMVGGVVLVAAIAVVAVLAIASGGSDSGPGGSDAATAAIPAERISNLSEAVRASGCTMKTFPIEGRGHTTATVKYKTNPPTSGDHDPTPAEDGIYDQGNPPDVEQSVHALEHGRIDIQYKPGTPKLRIDQLSALFEEKVQGIAGYKTLVFENQTDMTFAVAATAWTKSLTCPSWNDKVFDAIRAFRTRYIDKGPETVP